MDRLGDTVADAALAAARGWRRCSGSCELRNGRVLVAGKAEAETGLSRAGAGGAGPGRAMLG